LAEQLGGAMDVGLIKDRRPFEHRIGLTPGGVRALTENGHRVYLEDDAGLEAGFSNEAYRDVGATVVYSDEEVRLRSQMLIRLSPPTPEDCESFQPGQVVISAWHLAVAAESYFTRLLDNKVTTVGYEIIEDDNGHAPVLEAMSEIAGRLAVTIGAGLVLNEFGGKGLLVGGAPGIPPASMVILGAGTLGCEAAKFARGIGAHVLVLDNDINALRRVQSMTADEVPTMIATRPRIENALGFADILVCSVAVHGERTPIIVTRDMLKLMKPRSVIMDLSIDQGGCCETSRPTDFSNPTYEVDGIIHFCVPNLASTASRASTRSLTNAILPFVEEIADKGFDRAIRDNSAIRRGTYTYDGHCIRKGIAKIFDVPHHVIDGS
jgi:alanine dehydrogenase